MSNYPPPPPQASPTTKVRRTPRWVWIVIGVLVVAIGAGIAGAAAAKKSASTTTTSSTTSSTTTLPPATSAPPPTVATTTTVPQPTVDGTGTAAGQYAVAQAQGTAPSPAQIFVEVVLTPPSNDVTLVSWDAICEEDSGGVGSESGQSSVRGSPAFVAVKIPAPSTSCDVSTNAQLGGSGTLTIAIESKG